MRDSRDTSNVEFDLVGSICATQTAAVFAAEWLDLDSISIDDRVPIPIHNRCLHNGVRRRWLQLFHFDQKKKAIPLPEENIQGLVNQLPLT
jgi:hypothetical protein